jgi:hypothetical protein
MGQRKVCAESEWDRVGWSTDDWVGISEYGGGNGQGEERDDAGCEWECGGDGT